jgi:oligopeptidase B
MSPPQSIGGYDYYFKYTQGRDLPDYYRKKTSMDHFEEIVIDVEKEGKGFPFVAIDRISFSPDEKVLAFMKDVTAMERYSLHFKSVHSLSPLPDVIPLVGSFAFAHSPLSPSLLSVVYSVPDVKGRPFKVFVHRMGSPSTSDDSLLFTESDESRYVSVYPTRDAKYIILSSNSKSSSEIRLVDVESPFVTPSVIFASHENELCFAEHRNGRFIFVTNRDTAGGYQVVTAPSHRPMEWQVIRPNSCSLSLSLSLCAGFFRRFVEITVFLCLRMNHSLPHLKDSHTV